MLPVELPVELVIIVISYLPLTSITRLQRVDRQWQQFLKQNQNAVYRNAAWREGWIPSPETLLDELDDPGQRSYYSKRAMRGVLDWKDFCRRRRTIQRSWVGRASSTILSSPRNIPTPLPRNERQRTPYRHVHRIKVDEKIGIVMTTSAVGGLVVRDLESDEVLWELPTWYVHAYAHLEYDEGYVIFDRGDGHKEVWRRTEIREPSRLVTSFPDRRQLQMSSKLEAMPSLSPRAQFSPYALIIKPEYIRAYRFVYPNLLVASLERAYIWDVRTGQLVQTLDGIQLVLPFSPTNLNASQRDLTPIPGIHGERVATLVQTPALTEPRADDASTDSGQTSYHSDSESDPSPTSEDISNSSGPPETAFDSDTDQDEEEEETLETLPRFLGLIRYVEVSERHVIIVGRYLLRVISRATGKSVLDLPSAKPRYGAARWEVRSHAWTLGEVGDEEGTGEVDDYENARREGREVVRLPLEFTYEPYRGSSKLLIDQFVAAHISKDGKHLVAMLSGSRIIIIHYFEALCDILAAISSAPTSHFLPKLTRMARRSPFVQTSSNMPSTSTNSTSRRVLTAGDHREICRRVRRERDKTVFEHTLDIQLGAPQASGSIYLAYENGRVGVVTTNAVYIVAADLPPAPCSYRGSHGRGLIPSVHVARLPFFSHPSCLAGVSCLMMSDTGLYLNWNPTSPPPPPLRALSPGRDESEDGSDAELELERQHISFGPTGSAWYRRIEEAQANAYRAQQMRVWAEWESEYEGALEAYEAYAGERYHELPNGDMLVSQNARVLVSSEVSTVYSVDFFGAGHVGV